MDLAGNVSQVISRDFIFDQTSPFVESSLSSGVYASVPSLELSCIDEQSGCQTVFYTLDGSTPNTNSNVYSDPLTLQSSAFLSFYRSG